MTRLIRKEATLLGLSALSMMAGASVAPSLPQMAAIFSEVPNADFLVKMVITLPSIFIAVFSPLVGVVIDRFGRKKIILASLILYCLSGISGIYLDTLYGILIGRALLGVSIAGVMTATITLIGDYFEGAKLDRFMGLRSAFNAFGGVFFIFVGGFLANLNWRLPFYIYFSAILIFPAVIFFIDDVRAPCWKGKSCTDQSGIPFFLVATICLICMVAIMAFFIMPIEIPFLVSDRMHLGSSYSGSAIACGMLAAAIASLSYGRLAKRFNHLEVCFMTFFMMALGYVMVSSEINYLMVVAGLIVVGCGVGLIMPNTSVWLINVVPAEKRGKYVGWLTMSLYFGQFLSPVIFHPLAKAGGLPYALRISSMFMVALAVVFLALGFLKRNRLRMC